MLLRLFMEASRRVKLLTVMETLWRAKLPKVMGASRLAQLLLFMVASRFGQLLTFQLGGLASALGESASRVVGAFCAAAALYKGGDDLVAVAVSSQGSSPSSRSFSFCLSKPSCLQRP